MEVAPLIIIDPLPRWEYIAHTFGQSLYEDKLKLLLLVLLDLASGKTLSFLATVSLVVSTIIYYMRNTFVPWVLSINCSKELANPCFVMGSVMGFS